jgi:hypothetical protein
MELRSGGCPGRIIGCGPERSWRRKKYTYTRDIIPYCTRKKKGGQKKEPGSKGTEGGCWFG